MPSIVKSSIAQTLGQTLIDDVFLQKSKYYYSIGKSYPWGDSDTIPAVVDTEIYETASRKDALFLKKIDGTSVSFVIPRNNYVAGTIYDIYDDTISLQDSNFYVMNSDYNVYKCLYNANGAASIKEPFGVSTNQITYSDGYVWKFIYTIPPSLRNKFLTPTEMPVYNTITEKYYSRGVLSSVTIDSAGSGYTEAGTSIVVSGDGFLEDNPYKISGFSLINHGSGYTTVPTVELQDQFSNVFDFSNNTSVIYGQYIKVSDSDGVRIYRVEAAGITSSVPPTHYYTTYNNGTAALKHVSTKPQITATITADAVGSVKILESGFGYTTVPSITKSSPGSGATFIAKLTGGSLVSVDVDITGSGYSNTTMTVESPYPAALAYAQLTAYALGDIVESDVAGNTYYYKIDASGTTDASNPTHTTGSSLVGTAIFTVIAMRAKVEAVLGIVSGYTVGQDIEEIKVTNGGSGYVQESTNVVFSGGSPVNPAVATATIVGGKVDKVIITYPGYGYQSAPTVNITGVGIDAVVEPVMQTGYGYTKKVFGTFSAPDNIDGEPAILDTMITKTEAKLAPYIVDGKLRGIRIIDGGVGYSSATLTVVGDGTGAKLSPNFVSGDLNSIQAHTELFAIHGSISSIKMIDKGLNISSINITLNGDGIGATISPNIVNGKLEEIKVLSEGSGYTWATVTITVNNDATQPIARVIISPANGHGSNPIKELFTKSVALSTRFSNELNSGFVFNNEFRQILIYKNPLKYGLSELLNTKTASTCFSVSANTTSVPLEKNIIVTNQTDNKTYRVIDFTSADILLDALQTSTISANDVLQFTINNSMYTVVVSDVTLPQVDKYSGDILFIDNLAAFTPTDNQAVKVTTVINLL